MGKLDFVAVDFETSNEKMMACQIGIVVVRNGIFVEKRSILIQPPGNEYTSSTIKVHGINPNMTKHCPCFKDIWIDIEKYFKEDLIVAHNASFDKSVLENNLKEYGIEPEKIGSFDCTFNIFGMSLNEACESYGIPCENHHDALYDAECCAKLYLIHLNGGNKLPDTEKKNDWDNGYHTRLEGDLLKKDLSNADPDNPFYDKKVVITGILDNFERIELAKILKDLGADIDTSVTKRTNMVILGDGYGPKKMEKIQKLKTDGIDIRIILEDELIAMLDPYIDFEYE